MVVIDVFCAGLPAGDLSPNYSILFHYILHYNIILELKVKVKANILFFVVVVVVVVENFQRYTLYRGILGSPGSQVLGWGAVFSNGWPKAR